MRRLLIIFVFFVGQVAFATSAIAQVRVYARVKIPGELYPGERFEYSIVVENGGRPSNIDNAPLARFNPGPPSHQQSTRIVNFQTSSTNSVSFALTAPQPGPVRIEPVTLEVDGISYKTNPVEFTVAQPGTTDKLKLTCTLSEQTCYVGQPILLSVTWTILTQVEDASFHVPIFQSKDFYFEDPVLPGQKAGETHAIHEVPVELFQERRLVKGVEAATISFDKILIPKRSGTLSFDPVTVSARIPVGRVRTNDFFQRYRTQYKRFSVSSAPLALTVTPLPEAGKPEGYYGLVGAYTITTQASPTEISVGDPITLTMRIGGNPYLTPVQWPQLTKVPELTRNFRIPDEKASPKIEQGFKIFTQTIRANNDQITEIPAIPLATFDPSSGTYKTVTSKPIPLKVAASKFLGSNDLEGSTTQPVNREVEAIKEGLAAHYEGSDALINQGFSLSATVLSPAPLVMWAAPLLALLGSITFKLMRYTNPQQIAAKRRRQAAGRAKQDLRAVSSLEPSERPAQLAQVLRQFVGDRFDKTAGSLTADECYDVVKAACDQEEMAKALQDIVAMCEAARYAPSDMAFDEATVSRAIDLVDSINKSAKKKP